MAPKPEQIAQQANGSQLAIIDNERDRRKPFPKICNVGRSPKRTKKSEMIDRENQTFLVCGWHAVRLRARTGHAGYAPKEVARGIRSFDWRENGRAGGANLSTDSGVMAETPHSFRTRFENEKGPNTHG
jgi:nitrite reductase/ring-hydroxylating ferredoxin subunit